MNIAVKLAQDCPNAPQWASADYPIECREIGEQTEYTLEPGPWHIMTSAEFAAYKSARIGQYDAWVAAQVPNV